MSNIEPIYSGEATIRFMDGEYLEGVRAFIYPSGLVMADGYDGRRYYPAQSVAMVHFLA